MNVIKYIAISFFALMMFQSFTPTTAFTNTEKKVISAEDEEGVCSGDVIIVEIGRGTTRCGFESTAANSPIEFASTVRWDHVNFKNDFAALMDEVYNKLSVTNKSNHPVLILELDEMNSYRRVDMSDVLMGTHQVPWMYVMWNSVVLAYAHDPGSGTVMTYHVENNHSYVVPVCSGWPSNLYGVEFTYHEPENVRRADSTFWAAVRCSYYDRPDLYNNIVLSGENWDGYTDAEIAEFEERIKIQRLELSHVPRVHALPSGLTQRRHLVFWSAKKVVNDGVLLSWDLAFKQSHYQANGSDYIRQWVF